jgi:hypothetical protein
MIIRMPDGQMVDVTGMPQDQVVAMIQASQSRLEPEPQRETQPPRPEKDYQTREELMSSSDFLPGRIAQDVLTGVGRFATEMGQGIKQKYLQAFGDEGEAKKYTEEVITPERKLWEKGTEGLGAEDIGYYGAMMTPGMATGGLGIAGTAAMAGLEAGLMPTTDAEWESAFKQAGIGAGFGAGLRALPEGAAIFNQWRKNKQLGKVDDDIVALAEQFGVEVPRSVNRPSWIGRASEEMANIPIIGRPGATAMRQDAYNTLEAMGGRPTETTQEAFKRGKEALEEADSTRWQRTHSAIGDAPIDRQGLNNEIGNIIENLRGDTIGQQQIEQLRTLWKPVKQRQPFKGKTMDEYKAWKQKWDDQDQIRGFKGDTLEDLHKFRAKFGAAEQAAWREKGWDSSVPRQIYAALTDEMYRAADRGYGEGGVRVLQNAIDKTKEMHRTFANTRAMKGAVQDAVDSDSTFVRAALSNDPDRIMAMKTVLGQQGAEPVRREIVNDIMQQFAMNGGRSANKRIAKLSKPIEAFFGADEAAAMRGLGKFMDNIPQDRQSFFRNWVGGGSMLAAGLHAPLVTGAAATGAWQWTRRQDVVAMLQKLSKTPKDSKLYKALTNELTESAMAAMSVEQTRPPVPEIEINKERYGTQ